MESKNKGFTMVELVTVLAIVAILVGLLLPSLTNVRTKAKETTQKAQFSTIDLAILTFKNDYGDYPPSDWSSHDTHRIDYCGAQKLTEALLGRDLLGFHPRSSWSATDPTWYPPGPNDYNLSQRKGRYLELSTANAFRLGNDPPDRPGLFNDTGFSRGEFLARDTFVLCDVFVVRQITLPNKEVVKAGTPILYYKADTSKNKMDPSAFNSSIYNALDNLPLISLNRLTFDGTRSNRVHPLGGAGTYFYDPTYKIIDPKVTGRNWPYRPDSYILISAGADGLYGTADDIMNF